MLNWQRNIIPIYIAYCKQKNKNKKGIVFSKIFQYISSYKPIILVSNNEDIMGEIITETIKGEICKIPEKIETIS